MRPQSEYWAGRRVLVTGHTGFKGAWLSAWLLQLGAEVCGYALAPHTEPNLFEAADLGNEIRSHFGDLVEYEPFLKVCHDFQPEILLHLAAQAIVRESYQNPVRTYAVNVMGTAHVLEAARQLSSVRAVLVVTSDKCYENREWLWGYREDEALGGHDPYSSSKACAELVTDAFRRSFFEKEGKLVASARAGNVIGGGDYAADRLVPDAIRAFTARRPLELRSPGATRPWQHVLDPLCGYLLLAQRLLKGEEQFARAYNFGPIDQHPVGQVAEFLAQYWGEGATVETPPGEHPHEASRLHLDSSRARHQLRWKPRLELEEALRQTADFYRRWHQGENPRGLLDSDIEAYLELV